MIARAETAIYFIEDFLFTHNAKDGAYFRSILILFSYAIELALKSRVVMLSMDNEDVEANLRNLQHDIVKISKKLGNNELNSIGIKKVETRRTNAFLGYIITTNENIELSVENFTDVRYDFVKNNLRSLPEHDDVKKSIEQALQIIKKIKLNLIV